MNKMKYESPELDIRWFESEDVIALSTPESSEIPGDGWAEGDDW